MSPAHRAPQLDSFNPEHIPDTFDAASEEITTKEERRMNPTLRKAALPVAGGAGILGVIVYLLMGMKGDVAAHEPRLIAVEKLEPRVGALETNAAASLATQRGMVDRLDRIERGQEKQSDKLDRIWEQLKK